MSVSLAGRSAVYPCLALPCLALLFRLCIITINGGHRRRLLGLLTSVFHFVDEEADYAGSWLCTVGAKQVLISHGYHAHFCRFQVYDDSRTLPCIWYLGAWRQAGELCQKDWHG